MSVDVIDRHTRSMPLVTIAIPTFERRSGLQKAVNAARTQTYRNLEILISDNCSESYDVRSELADLSNADSRIKIVRQSTNIGATENFKFLCAWAQGTYLIWMADDDYCDPRFVEVLVEAAILDPNIVLCASDVVVIDEAGETLSVAKLEDARADLSWEKARRNFVRYPTSDIFFCIYGMFKIQALRGVLDAFRPAWKDFGTNAEVPFLASLAMRGRIVAVPFPYKFYRSHQNSGYVREMNRMRFVDRLGIRAIIRFRLIQIIWDAKLSAVERFRCVSIVLFDAVEATLKAPLRPLYRAVRTAFWSRMASTESSVVDKSK